MNTESWQEDNNRYLAASLQWLRLRLQRLVPEEPIVLASDVHRSHTEAAPSVVVPGRLSRWLGGDSPAPKALPLLPEPERPALEDLLKEASSERETAASVDPPPALILLVQRFGLSAFERDTLLLCAAIEFDPGLSSLYARAQGNPARNYPTFGLALSAFDDPAWEALSPHRPLRYVRLIEMNQPGATPLTSSPLRADERMVNFVKGLNVLDDRLATLMQAVDPVGEGA